MKITVVQSRGIISDPKVNFFKARMRVSNVDSEIFIFPEMFCSGYTNVPELMQVEKLKPLMIDSLSKLSDNKGCTVICGSPVQDGDSLYDSALIIDGLETARYDKINLNTKGLFDESAIFKKGSKPLIVDRQGLRMGIMLGHDLYVPDLCRYYAENAADILIVMAALVPADIEVFLKVAQANAIQYGIPIIVCNMTGNDPGTDMGGKSAYIGIDGTFIESCTAGSDVREIRIDVDELKAITAARVLPTVVELDEGSVYETKNNEADPNGPLCPFSM